MLASTMALVPLLALLLPSVSQAPRGVQAAVTGRPGAPSPVDRSRRSEAVFCSRPGRLELKSSLDLCETAAAALVQRISPLDGQP